MLQDVEEPKDVANVTMIIAAFKNYSRLLPTGSCGDWRFLLTPPPFVRIFRIVDLILVGIHMCS